MTADQSKTAGAASPDLIREPLFRVTAMLREAYAQAQAAEIAHPPSSPHRQDWTRRAEAVLRGWTAWEAFMEKELANV